LGRFVLASALLLGVLVPSCSGGDEAAVCEQSADDIEAVADEAVDDAGTSTRVTLGEEVADALLADLAAETYALDVHREQLGCDRDELEELLCPELFALAPDGPVATELVDTMLRTYDCED
jgi:hypothetical protein